MTDAAAKKIPKVLISCPMVGGIWDRDPQRWLRSYLNVLNSVRQMGCTHAPLFPVQMTWFKAMNYTFDIAFENDFDYILRMDDDVWGCGLDYFNRLMEADKDVIGACYAMRNFPYTLTALEKIDKDKEIFEAWKNKEQNFKEVTGAGVQKVDLIGFGMTLIRVEKFRALERPLFPAEESCPDDTWFAKLCADAGIEQFCHMDLKLAHRDVTPMNRLYLRNADARLLLQSGMIRRDGQEFHEQLCDKFGEDGMKDPDMIK